MVSLLRLLGVACLLTGLSQAQSSTPENLEGLVYTEVEGQKLTLDFYRAQGKGPFPAVVVLHGGGFDRGNSKDPSAIYCAKFLNPAGYAVFSINYRLVPDGQYPNVLEDVVTAIKFVKRNALRFNVNPNRVAILGLSTGGYLSNMMGVRFQDPESRIHAVVTLFGVSDLRPLLNDESARGLIGNLIRSRGWQEAALEASPLLRISPTTVPFLLIHGEKDETLPITQSTVFCQSLTERSVPCSIITIPGGGHSTEQWHTLPSVPDWEKQMVEFLNSKLKWTGTAGQGIRQRTSASSTAANNR